jgi:hypothetical protein
MNYEPVCLGCDPLGVRVPATVGELGGNSDGKGAKRSGHVYGHEGLLHPVGHLDCVGIRRVSVPRVFVSAFGVSGRQFHNQRLTFSPVKGEMRLGNT